MDVNSGGNLWTGALAREPPLWRHDSDFLTTNTHHLSISSSSVSPGGVHRLRVLLADDPFPVSHQSNRSTLTGLEWVPRAIHVKMLSFFLMIKYFKDLKLQRFCPKHFPIDFLEFMFKFIRAHTLKSGWLNRTQYCFGKTHTLAVSGADWLLTWIGNFAKLEVSVIRSRTFDPCSQFYWFYTSNKGTKIHFIRKRFLYFVPANAF